MANANQLLYLESLRQNMDDETVPFLCTAFFARSPQPPPPPHPSLLCHEMLPPTEPLPRAALSSPVTLAYSPQPSPQLGSLKSPEETTWDQGFRWGVPEDEWLAQMTEHAAPSVQHAKRVVPNVVHTPVARRAVRAQARLSRKQHPLYTEHHATRTKLQKLQRRLAQKQRGERQRRRDRKRAAPEDHMEL